MLGHETALGQDVNPDTQPTHLVFIAELSYAGWPQQTAGRKAKQ